MTSTQITIKLTPAQYDTLRTTLDRAIVDAPRQRQAGVIPHANFAQTLAAMRMLREDIFEVNR